MADRESGPHSCPAEALRLALVLGGLTREIEAFKRERVAEGIYAARLKLAAAHLAIRTAGAAAESVPERHAA